MHIGDWPSSRASRGPRAVWIIVPKNGTVPRGAEDVHRVGDQTTVGVSRGVVTTAMHARIIAMHAIIMRYGWYIINRSIHVAS